jgi:ABC-type uncharacterized transport system involved in gliding motility auxiliary subunit
MTPKRKYRSGRYAVVGILVASVGCVATAGLGIVRGSVALGLYTPARPESLTQWMAVSAGILVIGLALYAILDPAAVRRFISGRQARYGSNALVMSLAFVGILLVVNWLVHQNPRKFDFSEGKQHTLAPETIQALNALPSKVSAIAFYSSQYPSESAQQLLTDFKTSAAGKFDFRFVDPNADPVLAQNFGITGDGQIVLTMGELRETASYADENTMTQAMIRLISPQTRVVYFLTGHGEADINGSDAASMSRARETLKTKNYTVEELNLAATNQIPDDAKVIVVGGARHALLDEEVSHLKTYVATGGSLIVLADPTPFTNLGTAQDRLAEYLEAEWGVTLQDTVVIDRTSNQPFSAISWSYSSTAPITSRTSSLTIMPQTRSLAVADAPPDGVAITPLILTAEQSWGETDFASLESGLQVDFDAATDIPGPLTVAASAENSSTRGRVVIFGNSVFATNEGFDAYANGEVFTNSVDWAAQEAELINITPRTPVARTFTPPAQLPFLVILLVSVIVLPGLVLVAGISSWLARRRQG